MVTLMAIHTVIRMGTATRMTKGSIPPFRVLFVCLGNICRSPTAHGVFRAKARAAGLDVVTDCAGTGGWHIGQPPDRRAVRAAAARGYDLSDLRAPDHTRRFCAARSDTCDGSLKSDRCRSVASEGQ